MRNNRSILMNCNTLIKSHSEVDVKEHYWEKFIFLQSYAHACLRKMFGLKETNYVVKEKWHPSWEIFNLCIMAYIPVKISSCNHRYKRNRCNPTNLITFNISKQNSRPNNQARNKFRSNMPTILLTNICHISDTVDHLHAIVEMNSPSLIMITESWLNTDIPDSAINIGRMFNTYWHALYIYIYTNQMSRVFRRR
jgi:hypothetical protein